MANGLAASFSKPLSLVKIASRFIGRKLKVNITKKFRR